MLQKKILIGSLQIAGGYGTFQALSFARNLVIARLIGPEEFGLGLTLVLVVSLVELGADMAWDKLLVQDRRGEDARFQSTLHLFQVGKGLLFGIVLFLAAGAVTRALGVPGDIAWVYQALAAVPICVGLSHLDVKRYHRALRYYPDMASQVAGNAAAFVVGIGLALALGDFRAILAALLVRFLVQGAMTHVLAERPYRVGFSLEVAGRAWRFGWPLMINGVVLFAGMQGDRILIARSFGLETLGIYGAVALVTIAFSSLVGKVIREIGLPVLASQQDARQGYDAAFNRLGGIVALLAVGLSVQLFLVLPHALPALYGGDYEIPHLLIVLLVAALTIQIFRNWPVVAALALGESQLVMTANLLRMAGLAMAVAAVALGGSILFVAAGQVVGEAVATVAIFAQLKSRFSLGVRKAALFFSTILGVVAACTVFAWQWPGASLFVQAGVFTAVLAAALGVLYAVSPGLRNIARTLLARAAGLHVVQRAGSRPSSAPATHQGADHG